jgi:hypothetical protein
MKVLLWRLSMFHALLRRIAAATALLKMETNQMVACALATLASLALTVPRLGHVMQPQIALRTDPPWTVTFQMAAHASAVVVSWAMTAPSLQNASQRSTAMDIPPWIRTQQTVACATAQTAGLVTTAPSLHLVMPLNTAAATAAQQILTKQMVVSALAPMGSPAMIVPQVSGSWE